VNQRRIALLAFSAWALAAPAGVAAAAPSEPTDQVTVKGQVLHGHIVSFGDETLELETIYGEGTLRIKLVDIEDIKTVEPVRLYFGDRDETASGKLVAVEDGMLVLREDPDEQLSVPVAEIRYGLPQPEYDESFWRRLRSDFREWQLELDLSVDFEQGALDKNKARIGGSIDRRRDPFRLHAQVAYAIDVQQLRDEPEQTTKDEFSGMIVAEYDVWRKAIAFALMGGEFDIPRGVEARLYPTAGIGYRLFDTERSGLTPQLGFGYVYEDFQGQQANDYASGFLGLECFYVWQAGPEIRARLGYWPGLASPGKNWLFRSEVTATVPLWDPLAFRATFININDNNPTPDTGNNKFQTIMGLALRF
jgi:hypothetical protein